jgi:hypothetical protein
MTAEIQRALGVPGAEIEQTCWQGEPLTRRTGSRERGRLLARVQNELPCHATEERKRKILRRCRRGLPADSKQQKRIK